MTSRTFPMIPAGNGPIWFAVVTLILTIGACGWVGYEVYRQGNIIWFPVAILPLVVVSALMFYIAHSSRHLIFEVSRDQLAIIGFKGRKIPMDNLKLDEAKVLNLKNQENYRVRGKVQGTNMPGFKTGWCKLRNKEKALIYITDETSVLYIPTSEDYVLLLSVAQTKRMLEALQEAA